MSPICHVCQLYTSADSKCFISYILGRAAAKVRSESQESFSLTTRAPSHPTTGECWLAREAGSRIGQVE